MRRVWRLHYRGLGLVWGFGLLGQLPSAFGESATWLTWRSRAECPTAADIERRVTELLGGEMQREGELRVQAQAEPGGEGWDVAVDVTFGGHTGQRRVTVSSCEQAADFVAVAVVLAVQPALSRGTSDGVQQHPTAEQKPAAGKPARATSTRESQPLEPNAQGRRAPRIHVQVAGEGSVQPLPGPAFGAHAGFGVSWGPVAFGAGGRWLPQRTVTPREAVAPIDFSLLSARVTGAYSWQFSGVSLGPVIAAEGGAVFTSQAGETARKTQQPWFGVAGGGIVVLALAPLVSLFAEVEVTLPLTQPRFELNDGTRVHDVGLGGRAAVGARFFFSEE